MWKIDVCFFFFFFFNTLIFCVLPWMRKQLQEEPLANLEQTKSNSCYLNVINYAHESCKLSRRSVNHRLKHIPNPVSVKLLLYQRLGLFPGGGCSLWTRKWLPCQILYLFECKTVGLVTPTVNPHCNCFITVLNMWCNCFLAKHAD